MTATRCCERCASASACSTRFQNRLRLASNVSGSWNASLRSCSSSTLRSLTSRKLSASPAIAGSSVRLLPTHSSVLRRSPVSTHRFDRSHDAAARRGDLGEERGQPLAVAVGPEIEQIAPDQVVRVDRERPFGGRRGEPQLAVGVGDHDHVGGVPDQRRVTGLDDAGRALLPQQRVVAREHALAHHDERSQHEDDDGHRVDRARGRAALDVDQHQERHHHRDVGHAADERAADDAAAARREPARPRNCSRAAAASQT